MAEKPMATDQERTEYLAACKVALEAQRHVSRLGDSLGLSVAEKNKLWALVLNETKN